MPGAFGMQPMPQTPAPSAAAVGQALLQRRMATDPANAQPGMPQLTGNTMAGMLPQVGRRLLQAPPGAMAAQAPTPQGQQYGSGGF
jgi:hypothetical protein